MGTAGGSSFNLGSRLTLIFATLIVLILGGNALVVSQFQMIRRVTARLTGANQQLIAVLRLQANVLSFHRRLDDLAWSMDVRRLVTEAESLRRALKEQTQQTRTAIANLPSETVVNPSFLPTVDTIEVALPGEIDAIVELAKSGDWEAIQSRVANELSPNEDQTAILVDSINRQASGELARAVAETRSIQRRILIIVPTTAISTFLLAAFFGWSIARRFIEMRLEERVDERTRIGRELHDTLLQSFQGLLMRFQAVSNQLAEGEPKQELDETIDRATQAITEARDAVQGLRSSVVESADLAAAVGTLGKELAAADSRPPEFAMQVEGVQRRLHPILRDEVYRVAGEALRNAFRHADARRIEVEIRYDERQFRLRVRDDGKGIDPKLLVGNSLPDHFGLSGMRERAQQAGGKLTVWSQLESGTEVELRIPAAHAYTRFPASHRRWLRMKFSEKDHEMRL